jgi:hypothetical protein
MAVDVTAEAARIHPAATAVRRADLTVDLAEMAAAEMGEAAGIETTLQHH